MPDPPEPNHRAFLGWRIVALAIVTGALTGPGQTIGVSVFVDPFIDDLGLSRSSVSTAYLIGTMIAALGLPMVGTQIDRVGARRAMMAIGAGFGAALVAMSGVQGFTTLVVGFVAIRLLGQGSLSLVSTISVTHWFERRRGTAMGIFSTGMRVLMSLVPVGLSIVIVGFGWRIAWVVAGLAVWMIVVPIARFGLVDRPSDVGQVTDGPLDAPAEAEETVAIESVARSDALRTARFWVLLSATMSIGMLSTALNFHQISLLGDAGLTPVQAAVMFLPQVVGTAIAGVAFGYLADRLTGRILIPMVMALLAAALLLAANLTPGIVIVVYAICLGAAGGAGSAVSATLLPRWFGLRHIGAIQGAASLLMVASTSLGPVAFSMARDIAGDYEGAAMWFALIPVAAGISATFLRSAQVVGVEARD
jgi:MFS family permease